MIIFWVLLFYYLLPAFLLWIVPKLEKKSDK